MNKSFEFENNNNNLKKENKDENKQNLTSIIDYKNENNMNFENKTILEINNKNTDKDISNNQIDLEQSNLKNNESFNMNERKIISILGNNQKPKEKKIKFNDLPNLNIEKKDKQKSLEKNIQELDNANLENNDINNSKKIEEYNKLEINYKQMFKELEELKNENSYIKNKLEEISKNQKNKNGIINTSKKMNNIMNNNNNNNKISKNEFSTYNKYKKNLNIKKVTSGWNNKIPLLTSCNAYTSNKNIRTKRLYTLNSFKNLTKQNNNIITYKKRDKSEFEKFNAIKNKFLLKNNRILTKSESYNNFNKSLSNELNEKNKIIKKLNNNLAEQNKITENRISLLIKDKNVINERLYLLKKEKEEYKIKKESEIKKYINDLNNNQRIINELNTEKDRLIRSKNEIELLNHKLKNIILEEKTKRKEYEHMYKMHNLEIKEKENNEYKYQNKESIMKLKYDIMLKENREMKQELNSLKEKLAKSQIDKNQKEEKIDIKEIKEKNEIDSDNINNSKIFLYQEQDIKESENENIEEEKSIKEKTKNGNEKEKENNKRNQNNQNNEEIKINNEELKLFNNHINMINENKQNQIKISEMQKDIEEKNQKIIQLQNDINKYITENEHLIKEKEDLNSMYLKEQEKNKNLEELSKTQKLKYEKYKHKYEEYKQKAKNLKEDNEIMKKGNFHYRGGSFINDTKNIIKLRESIFQLREKLDEEKTKSEALKIIAEDEKEKNDNFKDKYNTAKKLNTNLINKLKERDIAINKNITKENNLLKKKLEEQEKKIEELKNEIKSHISEIDKYKIEIKKFSIKEKENIREKITVFEELKKKDILLKGYNKKIETIKKMYEEEKNKNKNLTIEIKELNFKFKRIMEDNTHLKSIHNNYQEIKNTLVLEPKHKQNNNSFDHDNKLKDKYYDKIENKSSNSLIKFDKYKVSLEDIEKNKARKKFSVKNDQIFNDEDESITISESFNDEKEIINNELKENVKKEKKEKIVKKDKDKDEVDSETISEDNPELFKEVDKIMNMNKLQNDFDKINEKTNSSFKDDKSTKMDIDKI